MAVARLATVADRRRCCCSAGSEAQKPVYRSHRSLSSGSQQMKCKRTLCRFPQRGFKRLRRKKPHIVKAVKCIYMAVQASSDWLWLLLRPRARNNGGGRGALDFFLHLGLSGESCLQKRSSTFLSPPAFSSQIEILPPRCDFLFIAAPAGFMSHHFSSCWTGSSSTTHPTVLNFSC